MMPVSEFFMCFVNYFHLNVMCIDEVNLNNVIKNRLLIKLLIKNKIVNYIIIIIAVFLAACVIEDCVY